jgi:hypothetical protein
VHVLGPVVWRVEGRTGTRGRRRRAAEDARARRRDADADAAHMTRQRRVARSCLFMRRDASHPHAHVTSHMGGHLHISGVRWHGGTAHMDMDMNMAGTWVKHVKPIAASLSTQFQYQFNMYRTCCKDMLATWGWLPRNVRLCARPHTLYVIRPSLRQSETKSARDKMWRVVRPRSSYFPLRSAAPATPGAGSCRSPRRICW